VLFKASLAGLLLAVVGLQYKIWFGDVGYFGNQRLQTEIVGQQQRTQILRHRNRLLTAEVLALQHGYEAVESRARANLGMIKQGETFYLVSSEQR
jgi:cell division protein FtsB